MKKVSIKFTRHPGQFGLAYFPDDVADFEEKQAADLCEAGVAVRLMNEKETLPDDLPGREAIAKAGITLNQLADIEDYQSIEGVGKSTAEKLTKYFKTEK